MSGIRVNVSARSDDLDARIEALRANRPDREARVDALVGEAQTCARSDIASSDRLYQAAIAEAREEPEYGPGLLDALVGCAFSRFRMGDLAQALKMAEEARLLGDRLGRDQCAVDAVITAGQIHRTVGNFDEAVECLFEGMERAKKSDLPALEARACNSLGALFGTLDNQEDSLRYFERALELLDERPGEGRALQTIRSNLSNCLRKLGRPDEAVIQARQAVSDCEASGDDQDACYYLGTLAAALVACDEFDSARETFARAEALSPRSPGRPWPDVQQQYADALLKAGQPGDAIPILEAALKLAESMEEWPLVAQILQSLSRCHAGVDDFERAYHEELRAQEIKAQMGAEGSVERHRVYQVMREADENRQRSEILEQLVDERTKELKEEVKRRRAAQDAMRRQAFTNELTGLPNRLALIEEIERRLDQCADEPSLQFGILFMDVHRFRRINDSLGYQRADRVITELASRLMSDARDGGQLFHLMADEFVLVIDPVSDDVLLARRAASIRSLASQPIQVDEREIHLSMDIGGVIGNASYQQAEHLLLDADTAMTLAKRRATGFQFFNRQMREQAAGQFRLETELRRAIRQRELEVHYQPIIDQRQQCLSGYEALVRWRHPVRGVLPAADFVSAAAQLDLLPEIDRLVLRTACEDLRRWCTRYRQAKHISVSVNLSPQHMAHPNWDKDLDSLLNEYSDVCGQISLEITEAALMDLGHHQVARLENLRRRGIGWVIDDFGTGYSSLSYLQRLPVDCLKIDRSFVSGLPEGERELRIIAAIVELARALRLETVAEGVEEVAQLESLKSLGCNLVQGFLFAPALPEDKATAFLGGLPIRTDA